jgi:hypothetical protein
MSNPAIQPDDDLLELMDLDLEDLEEALPKSDSEIEEAYANLSFRVIYQSHNYFLPQLKDLIDKGEVLNLRPEYQRRLRWGAKQKSLLIESLFLNIPIPPIFLYEADAARYEVMDGQQRLNAIHSYLANDFKLTGLKKLAFVNGRSYSKLPPKLKRALDRASISAIVLLQETKGDKQDPYFVRRYVFERLNSGGQKLNAQEMRNSLYRGEFNNLIVKLARNSDFCEAFAIPKYTETDESEYYENPERQKNALYRSMGDCQIVLRFFALMEDQFILGSMSSILDKAMTRHEKVSADKLAQLRETFELVMKEGRIIFGDQPFILMTDGRPKISIALYDAEMGALYRRRDNLAQLETKKAEIRQAMETLKADQRELITGQANTAQAIKDRIAAVTLILDQAIA